MKNKERKDNSMSRRVLPGEIEGLQVQYRVTLTSVLKFYRRLAVCLSQTPESKFSWGSVFQNMNVNPGMTKYGVKHV